MRKYLLAAAAASAMSTAAVAADMPIAPPPAYSPPPVEDFGGWYLRGDIGFSNQQVKHLSNALEAPLLSQSQHASFNSAGIFGLGAGYQFNNWFRADVTGEFRSSATLNGYEVNTFSNGGVLDHGFNKYTANKSEWLVLANAYVDLGTWWCVTPFIGAGVGGARVTMANYTDVGQTALGGPSSAFADSASRWNFAWAVHAGLAYKVSPSLTLELAYRYVDLGDGITGDVIAFDGTNNLNNPTTFKHLTSHDLKFGVRWAIDPVPAYAPPELPLMRKG
ncbi:opacity protein-like surface antigen [Nitrobacteraceae bacterium AZCC 1564]